MKKLSMIMLFVIILLICFTACGNNDVAPNRTALIKKGEIIFFGHNHEQFVIKFFGKHFKDFTKIYKE